MLNSVHSVKITTVMLNHNVQTNSKSLTTFTCFLVLAQIAVTSNYLQNYCQFYKMVTFYLNVPCKQTGSNSYSATYEVDMCTGIRYNLYSLIHPPDPRGV